MRRSALVFLVACIPQCFGQSVVSVRSGLINFSEGDVLINGQPLQRKFGNYTSLKEGSDLVTRAGRAELLLTPNTYLRVGAESGIRMVANSLADTRLELMGGSAVLDSSTAPGKTPIEITVGGSVIRFTAPGRFRMDSEPPQLRVFDGDAEVETGGKTVKVARLQLLPLSGAPIVKIFSEGSDNLLDIWSDQRRSLIANNLASSQNLGDPLTDPDPATTGSLAYPGYIPLLGYPPMVGGTYGGLGVGYAAIVDPYGIYPSYGAYSPYGIYVPHPIGTPVLGYGVYGIYSPVNINTLRHAGIGNYPTGLIGLRPAGGISPGEFRPFTPNTIGGPRPFGVGGVNGVGGVGVTGPHPINGPHPVAPVPHVGAGIHR